MEFNPYRTVDISYCSSNQRNMKVMRTRKKRVQMEKLTIEIAPVDEAAKRASEKNNTLHPAIHLRLAYRKYSS